VQREYDGEQIVPGSSTMRVRDVRQINLETHLSLEHRRAAGSASVFDPERQRINYGVAQLGNLQKYT